MGVGKSFIMVLVAVTTTLHCLSLRADDTWTANFYFENDLFGETDQNYTNGLRLSLVSPNLSSYVDDPVIPAWLNRINKRFDRLLGLRGGDTRNAVFSVGQLIYTPEDNFATELIKDDRPYAGYLYTGIAYHARTDNRLDSVEVNIGIVGPSAQGEWAQNTVHELRDIDTFNGWDNQLKDEPILQFTWEQKRRLFEQRLTPHVSQDFIAHGGAALGNKAIYINLGAEYRLGWGLPKDFGTSAIRPGGDNSAPGVGDERLRHSDRWFRGLHGFIATDVRAVAHDIFLDGNTVKHSHSVNREPLVAEIGAGVSVLLSRWKLSYAQIYRTREFTRQKHHHSYGSLTISYSW